jgi:hypothetical protein
LGECCSAGDVEALVLPLHVNHHGDGGGEREPRLCVVVTERISNCYLQEFNSRGRHAKAMPVLPPLFMDGRRPSSTSWPQADSEALQLRSKIPQGCRPKWFVPGDDITAAAIKLSWRCGGEDPG